MTAPKIDTQAPERVWLDVGTFNGAVGFAHSKQHHPGEWKSYVAEDLSAAREAAAVERAFRDGLAYATNCRVKDHDQAWQQSLARERLGSTAALDRLIAERVREAVREIKDAWDWWQVDSYDRCASVVSDAIDAALMPPAPTTGDDQ